MSKDTVYVAFLDSDDQWEALHLKNAVFALGKGYDFYYSDFKRHFSNYSRFQNPENKLKFLPNRHLKIDKERNLYEFSGSFLMLYYETILLVLLLLYIGMRNIRILGFVKNFSMERTRYSGLNFQNRTEK